jgi:uncharacterized membrane protein
VVLVEKKKATTTIGVVTFFFAFLCGVVVTMKAVSPSYMCLRIRRQRQLPSPSSMALLLKKVTTTVVAFFQ